MPVWHLYAVADPGTAIPAEALPGVTGVRGAPVQLVNCGRLAVAASELQDEPDRPTPADLSAHADVACWVMAHGVTVLPFRFGITAPSQQAVCRLVQLNEELILRRLEYLRGRVEASLVAFWEREALRQALLRHRWVEARAHHRSWQNDYAARVELGRLAESVVQRWQAEYESQVRQALIPHVIEVRAGNLMGIRMLLNLALLVPQREEQRLREAVAELQQRLQGRLRFRLTVPLPPFSFASVTLRAPSGDELTRQ